MFTKEEYEKAERSQTLHRSMNTILLVLVLILGFFFVKSEVQPLYQEITGVTEQRAIESEIVQIVEDEGYKRCVYKDSLGLPTVGFGHLMLPTETFKCIDSHYAVKLLRKDYTDAQLDVETRYPWADSDVKLVLINLTFNMGSTRLSKFTKTLSHLKDGEHDLAAGELLDSVYARQVPRRASMMAARIMRLQQ
jgi:lysozyme